MKDLAKSFSNGEYPIKQVIFCGLDSVTGPILMSSILKPNYGKMDIIHFLGEKDVHYTDVGKLLLTTLPVVTTCWNYFRTLACLPAYVKLRGWKEDDVRVYSLATFGDGRGLVDYAYESRSEVNSFTVPRAIKFLSEYGGTIMREISRAAWFTGELGEFGAVDRSNQLDRKMEAMDVLLLGEYVFKGSYLWTNFLQLTVGELSAINALIQSVERNDSLLKAGFEAWNEKNIRKGRPSRTWDSVSASITKAAAELREALKLVEPLATDLEEFRVECSGERAIIRAYNRILYFNEFKNFELQETEAVAPEP